MYNERSSVTFRRIDIPLKSINLKSIVSQKRGRHFQFLNTATVATGMEGRRNWTFSLFINLWVINIAVTIQLDIFRDLLTDLFSGTHQVYVPWKKVSRIRTKKWPLICQLDKTSFSISRFTLHWFKYLEINYSIANTIGYREKSFACPNNGF